MQYPDLESTAKERATATRLRDSYDWLKHVSGLLRWLMHDTHDKHYVSQVEVCQSCVDYVKGTLDVLIADLEQGTYPFRDAQVDHPTKRGSPV